MRRFPEFVTQKTYRVVIGKQNELRAWLTGWGPGLVTRRKENFLISHACDWSETFRWVYHHFPSKKTSNCLTSNVIYSELNLPHWEGVFAEYEKKLLAAKWDFKRFTTPKEWVHILWYLLQLPLSNHYQSYLYLYLASSGCARSIGP